MKNLFIALLIWAFIPPAAPFEGTIRYNVEVKGELGPMASMLPKYYEYSFKDSNIKLQSDAAMVGEMLIRSTENRAYLINRGQKTAYQIKLDQDGEQVSKPKITKTDETASIAGYKCRKYMVEMEKENVRQTVWITTDITVHRPKNASKALNFGNFFMEGIEGFPLKMDVNMQGIEMTMTATEVKPGKLKAADFELPDGFAVKDFNFSSILGN